MWISFFLFLLFIFYFALRRINEPRIKRGILGGIYNIGLLLNAPYKIDSMVWMKMGFVLNLSSKASFVVFRWAM
jgi:hypothetical protein